MYKQFGKRGMDLLLVIIAIIFLTPVFLTIAFLIKVDSKGPVLFKQKRIGKNKKLFTIYKFRTMKVDTPQDTPTHLMRNPDYFITNVGRFLRKSSLDELPQLFNILLGDMSLIGPRPALWNQRDLIEERDCYQANTVCPGVTGWAQINGRDELPIPIKAKLDGDYVASISLKFDVMCLFKTLPYILKKKGIAEGDTTVTRNNILILSETKNRKERKVD